MWVSNKWKKWAKWGVMKNSAFWMPMNVDKLTDVNKHQPSIVYKTNIIHILKKRIFFINSNFLGSSALKTLSKLLCKKSKLKFLIFSKFKIALFLFGQCLRSTSMVDIDQCIFLGQLLAQKKPKRALFGCQT